MPCVNILIQWEIFIGQLNLHEYVEPANTRVVILVLIEIHPRRVVRGFPVDARVARLSYSAWTTI